jgi:hypothetical protein
MCRAILPSRISPSDARATARTCCPAGGERPSTCAIVWAVGCCWPARTPPRCVIGLDPQNVEHLRLAYEQGLGQILEDKIELTGATLEELRMPWQPPELTDGFLEVIIPGIHLLTDA